MNIARSAIATLTFATLLGSASIAAAAGVALPAKPASAKAAGYDFKINLPAAPTDRKTWPGMNCKTRRPDDAHMLDYTHGNLKVRFNKLAEVYCPIMRDNTRNTDGSLVRVDGNRGRYNTQSVQVPFKCTLRSISENGEVLDMHTVEGDGNGKQILMLEVAESSEFGHVNLSCHLSGNSAIFSYTTFEFIDDEDL